MKRILLKCSLTLLVAHLFLFLLLNFVPEFIPVFGQREINLHGVIGFLVVLLIIRYYLKQYFWEDPEVALGELASIGLLAELIAQALFQLVRQFTYPDPSEPVHIYNYFGSVLAMSVVAGAVSFYIAGRLKENGVVRIISILLWSGLGFAYRYLHVSGIL